MNAQNIIGIYGMEPRRDGEYPLSYAVGSPDSRTKRVLTRIEYEIEHRGTHDIVWFAVFAGNDVVARVSENAIAEIQYATATEEQLLA